MIRRISVSAALILAVIISAIVEATVVSKHYATLVFSAVFFLYWTGEMIFSYINFRKTYPEKYKFYKAKLVNESNISLEVIEQDNKKYYKRFKSTMLKDSLLKLGIIAGLFGVAVTLIVAMFI